METDDAMNYVEQFEDEGFLYKLSVDPSPKNDRHLHTYSQGDGYYCRWNIIEKSQHAITTLPVTDDQCEVIIFDSVKSAVEGARKFLSI
jgi:hypothetical protein